jgi:hypothetical protein
LHAVDTTVADAVSLPSRVGSAVGVGGGEHENVERTPRPGPDRTLAIVSGCYVTVDAGT